MLGSFLFIDWLVGFKTRSHCGAQNGFELAVVLSQSPKRGGGRPVPPHLVLWPPRNQWLGSINPLDGGGLQVLVLENVVLRYRVCISVACGVDTKVPDSVWGLSQGFAGDVHDKPSMVVDACSRSRGEAEAIDLGVSDWCGYIGNARLSRAS